MYPLADESLTLFEIARHWCRDLPQHPPQQEVLQTLLGAMWNGELRATLGPGERSTHQQLLRILTDVKSHPGILIYDDPMRLPPDTVPMPDGGAVVDIRRRIHLPGDTATWTPEVISDACAALAKCAFDDYSEDLARLVLAGLEITKEDFAMFCDTRGYERPAFWFDRGEAAGSKPVSFPGRPSMMRALMMEMRRRAKTRQLASQLRDEVRALEDSAKRTYADQQVPGHRAIENALRSLYRGLKAQADRA